MGFLSSLNPKLGLDKRVSFCIRFKYNAAYWFTPHGSLSCGFIAQRFTGPFHSERAPPTPVIGQENVLQAFPQAKLVGILSQFPLPQWLQLKSSWYKSSQYMYQEDKEWKDEGTGKERFLECMP